MGLDGQQTHDQKQNAWVSLQDNNILSNMKVVLRIGTLPPDSGTLPGRKLPFYPAALETPEAHGIITVSQLFETHLSGGITKAISHYPSSPIPRPSTKAWNLHAAIFQETVSE
jgi:hypothetical protein